MKLDYQKELTPVLYGDSGIKILPASQIAPGELCFETHWHDRMELLRIFSGEIRLTLGDRSITVLKDNLILIPPALPHHGVAGERGANYRTIMFDPAAFFNGTPASEKLLKPIARQQFVFLPATDDADVLAAADFLLAAENDPDAALECVGKIYELLGLLCRRCSAEKESFSVSDERFRDVLDYIGAHFSADISSRFLCRRFGYDEAYFCRRFKAVTGLTPMRYIRILRLEEARRLIRGNGLSVAEAAVRCGFSDAGYFTRSFRRHFGVTPSQYAATPASKNFPLSR